MPTRAKDKCPSCFQPIAPTDFLCPHCELILDPSQLPEKPLTEVSVVRRMLEAPQRSAVTAAVPDKKKDFRRKPGADDAPTRKLDLGPELAGVPIVVASLSKMSSALTELEAWLVSLIDGQSDAASLAGRAQMREFELRVILRTLNEKHIIDFADEPLPDEALEPPLVEGTLSTTQQDLDPVQEEDEPVDFSKMAPPAVAAAPPPPPPAAPVAAAPAAPSYGANVDRRDGRFVAPPTRAPVVPPPPPPPSPPPAPVPAPPSVSRPAVARAASAAAVPYPASSRPVVTPKEAFSVQRQSTPPAAPPPERQTDPRIAYTGTPNRKVLDALKQVKRNTDGRASSPPKVTPPEGDDSVADILARDSLQIALRMEQSGRLDEAIRFLEKSIGKSPDAASLYNRLGIILMRERADLRRAEQLIRKATELAPTNGVYSQNLQQVLSRLALRNAR